MKTHSVKNGMIVVIYIVSYFLLFSKSCYRMGQIINLYNIGAICSLVVITLLLNKGQIKKISVYVQILMAITIFVFFNRTMDRQYGSILRDFYLSGYDNLLQLGQYKLQKGNYIVVYETLSKEGIVAYSMSRGYTNKNLESYQINEENLMIFDWDTKRVNVWVHPQEMIQIAKQFIAACQVINYDYYGEILAYELNPYNIFVRCETEGFYIKLYPADTGFELRIDESTLMNKLE